MSGWFELIKTRNGQFKFVLKNCIGEILLTSDLYTTRASAGKGIVSVRTNCNLQERYERKVANNGRFYFNLKAANHQVISTSKLYSTEMSRDKGIVLVKENGKSNAVQ